MNVGLKSSAMGIVTLLTELNTSATNHYLWSSTAQCTTALGSFHVQSMLVPYAGKLSSFVFEFIVCEFVVSICEFVVFVVTLLPSVLLLAHTATSAS